MYLICSLQLNWPNIESETSEQKKWNTKSLVMIHHKPKLKFEIRIYQTYPYTSFMVLMFLFL